MSIPETDVTRVMIMRDGCIERLILTDVTNGDLKNVWHVIQLNHLLHPFDERIRQLVLLTIRRKCISYANYYDDRRTTLIVIQSSFNTSDTKTFIY